MSNDKIEKDSREVLKLELDNAEEKGKRIAEKGRELTEYGQYLSDLASVTRDFIYVTPNLTGIDSVIKDWKLLNNQADITIQEFGKIDFKSFNTSSGVASISVSGYFDPKFILPINEASIHPLIIEKYNKIEEIISKNSKETEVISLLKEFELDQAAKGRKSALEQFQIAQEAFKKPINPASTSLIPMRESIRTTIDFLLKRRSKQEKTGNERAKIISIGKQLKRDTVPEEPIESLSDKWVELLDKYLSSAKEESISRDEWRNRLAQATIFLSSLLNALDVKKCK